ncbi:MAG: sporulation transcriptional regulator SpoIIID [Eubacteriales bacterium]
MVGTPEERALVIGQYILQNRTTVRQAAKAFGVSKSTVHKDVTQRLEHYNHALFLQVQELLEQNKAERHIRGGLATQAKYKKQP